MKQTLITVIGIISLLSCSCIISVIDYSGSGTISPRREFHRSVTMEPGGTLSVENIDGNIEIQGWEENEVEVYARKMISRPNKARVYIFSKGDFLPKIDFDQFENFIRIKTIQNSYRREGNTVDYYISVPQSINLRDIVCKTGNIHISDLYGEVYVELARGNVMVENFSGSLEASVINGSVSGTLYDLRDEDEIMILTREGDITVYLEENVQAMIEASAPNGEVVSEFDAEESSEEDKVEIQLGEEGAFVSLSALNGNVRINKIKTE